MDLNTEIEFLFKTMDNLSKNIEYLNPIARRLYLIGIISEMTPIISELSYIESNISKELSVVDASLKSLPEILSNFHIDIEFLTEPYTGDLNTDTILNYMTDMFPLGDENYSFTSGNIDKLKTGIRTLCGNDNISERDIKFAIDKGVRQICSLLHNISNKKKNIKKELFEEFWDQIEFRDDDLFIESAQNDYEVWKEEHENCKMQLLKDKVTQEILKLLQTGIFTPDTIPTNREINNSVIKISDEALEPGMIIPEGIGTDCARFSKYVFYKEDILFLDYTALGKYIYKHINEISDEQINALIYFNFMLWPIHRDMVELKPSLNKYLQLDEDNTNELLDWAISAIMACKDLLQDGVNESFLQEYIRSAFDNEELKLTKRLNGQSKYTTICRMIGMLKSTAKVFRLNTVDVDFAKRLSALWEKGQNTLRRYVNQKNQYNENKLNDWTTAFVKDRLCNEKEKVFLDISRKN